MFLDFSSGADELVEPLPIAGELLVAARDEVTLHSTDGVSEFDSRSSARRLLTRLPYRLTPRAARLVAQRAKGGAPDTIVAMMGAGQLVLIQRCVQRPIPAAFAPKKRSIAPPAEPLFEPRKATSWIKFKVVHHITGEPFAGVRLAVRIPSGLEVSARTDSRGTASLDEIDPGICDAWCPLKDARLARTVAFVAMGQPPPREVSPALMTLRSDRRPAAEWIANIDEHHVETGESLESIAKAHAYSWRELAEFNWGTSVPDEINRHLRDDVGCTVKTRDGFNYRFTSQDEPGLIYIPRPWSQSGLATEQTHVIQVRIAAGFRLILDNDYGLRIPQAEYEATLADGSVRTGRLGRSGVALIKDPPPGPVEVRYTDLNDVEAKSLAVTVRKAFDDRQPKEIHRLFRYPRQTIQRAFKAYDEHFNDYRGSGLRADIEAEWGGDEDASLLLYTYLADAELAENQEKTAPAERVSPTAAQPVAPETVNG